MVTPTLSATALRSPVVGIGAATDPISHLETHVRRVLSRSTRRAAVAALGSIALAAATAATLPVAASASAASSPSAASSAARAGHPHHRVCGQPKAHQAACHAEVRDDVSAHALSPNAVPAGYGPADLQSAYKLPSSSAGSGQTVAIVDAYDLPTAEQDLNTYRSQFGLPACTTANGCFRKVNQRGGSTPPAADAGWGQEIALDLDMVSAACPNCKILLVEADTPSMTNLGAGVNQAVALGAKFVSNSYGGSESSSDSSYDSSYFNHPGVAITVSSGDNGYGTEYPAASKYVTAVGGTSLSRASNTRGWTESAWSGAGSGCSSYDAKPSWQSDSGCSRRSIADVAAVADPNTGVAVYDSTVSGGQSGWMVFGGTSAAAPIVAGTYALAGAPAASTYPAQYPYQHAGSLFDVAGGSNGSCSPSYLCNGASGYDGPTGLGTPNGAAAFSSSGGTSGGGTGGGTGGSTCTAGQLLGNGGFETGSAAPWSASSGVVSNASAGEPSHSGSWLAWLDGYGSSHTDSLSQAVTIPAGCTTATFSFWLHVDTAETTSTAAYDKLTVKAGSTTLATYSNLSKVSGYVQKSFNLAGYAGQTVSLSFTGTEDSSLATSFTVDDAAVTVS
ncbi:MAG TPA: hypothetical protein VFS29_13815 [Motilibacteraceae bacterium]|nr:hypothetical protein [Motilibacteraceae bacterium]